MRRKNIIRENLIYKPKGRKIVISRPFGLLKYTFIVIMKEHFRAADLPVLT